MSFRPLVDRWVERRDIHHDARFNLHAIRSKSHQAFCFLRGTSQRNLIHHKFQPITREPALMRTPQTDDQPACEQKPQRQQQYTSVRFPFEEVVVHNTPDELI